MKLTVTVLVFCVAGLLALGMTMLYSLTIEQPGAHYLMTQLTWCIMGLGFGVVAAGLDYQLLKKIAWPLLGVAVVLLALVLVPHIGLKVKGARRWLVYGPVRLQPSELAKVALIIALAWYGEHYQRQMRSWKKGVLVPGLLVAVVLGFIFVEPDRGTTILLSSVAGVMLLIAGVRWIYIVPPIVAAAAALGVSLWHDPMRYKRMLGWLYLEEHKDGVG